MMFRRFLVFDSHDSGRVVSALLLAFPDAVVQVCRDHALGMSLMCTEYFDAVIADARDAAYGACLVRALRSAIETTPLVVVASNREAIGAVLEAGATAVVIYDHLFMLADVVERTITRLSRFQPRGGVWG
jgi:DNA-binding NarL/FixJ family response regulator